MCVLKLYPLALGVDKIVHFFNIIVTCTKGT
jgi:hypothetical protein